jgi:hypothetical protein
VAAAVLVAEDVVALEAAVDQVAAAVMAVQAGALAATRDREAHFQGKFLPFTRSEACGFYTPC